MRDQPRTGLTARLSAVNESAGWTVQRVRHSRPVRTLAHTIRHGRAAMRARSGGDRQADRGAPTTATARTWPMSVLSVAERSLPQCYHYRLRQKEQLLRQLNVPFDELGLEDETEALSRLQLAKVLIVYRLPKDARTTSLLLEARRLQIPVVFEVDDVVYRRDLVAGNPNLDTLPWSLKAATIKGADDYRNMLPLVDANLASTEPLAADMRQHNGQPSFVLENGIDEHMLEVAAGVESVPSPPATCPVVMYGSGSRAHDRDFELAAPGLARWLSQNPQGRLTLVGSVALPKDLVPFGPQIRQLPELPFPEYLRELSRSTIALAPLTSDAFNLYKSHIRYLESGLVGTPLIASPTLYADYIDDGRTGLIAEDGDWFTAISRLAADPDMQHRIAQEARDHVREWELDQRPLDQTRKMLHSLVPEWAGP